MGSDPNNGVRLQHWGLTPLLVPDPIACHYEVHVGDDQTGPIGDKLSLMVGRLIA